MSSALRRTPGRPRRLLATALLLTLPLATTACSGDEGSEDGGVEQNEDEDDD